MYTRAYDRERGLLFGLWTGASNTDEDFGCAAEDMLRLDREGEGRSDGVMHIAETDPKNPIPSAMQRRRLTVAAEALSCAKVYHFCMVTRNALVRGVITAIGWFAPSRPSQHNGCRATFEDALAWAEEHRPGVAARFHELRREARALAVSRQREAEPGLGLRR